MDGTGIMLRPFVELLPTGIDVNVVRYPEDIYLTHQQLADRVRSTVPSSEPYVIIAESYSGPSACLMAAHSVGDLQAVVFVASFASLPWGRIGRCIAKILPTALFRPRMPAGILRWLLMDGATPEMISEAQDVIARVRPEVLAQRLRDSLNADYATMLQGSNVRIVCLFPESDRLLGTRARRRFLAARPDAEIVTIAGPHSLLQCAPARSLAALQKMGVLRSS
jgi:pimeloyl-[acyl-carrier protein] methyl ester esterase